MDPPTATEENKVKRIKFRISTWEKGEQFMRDLGQELDTPVEVRDATQVIVNSGLEVHCFPDDRGFSFITCKLNEEALEKLVAKYRRLYTID